MCCWISVLSDSLEIQKEEEKGTQSLDQSQKENLELVLAFAWTRTESEETYPTFF